MKFVDLASLFSQFSLSVHFVKLSRIGVAESTVPKNIILSLLAKRQTELHSWSSGKSPLGVMRFRIGKPVCVCAWINAVLLSSRIQIKMEYLRVFMVFLYLLLFQVISSCFSWLSNVGPLWH